MVAQFKIIVQNLSSQNQDFYVFQQQASFGYSGSPPTILSTSLACAQLAPSSFGAQLDFGFETQVYAGALNTNASAAMTAFSARISFVTTLAVTSQASAAQPIALTPAPPNGTANNCSTLMINPLGLSTPQNLSSLAPGSFGIQIPTYTPALTPDLFCGCAVINQNGIIVLSSFIAPAPNNLLTCAPLPVYYVNRGNHQVGETIPYDTSLAAECDFSTGYQVITVTYNPDGTFTTSGS